MISMRMLQKLTFALPRCSLLPPDDVGRMYIIDQNNERVGDIHFESAVITIYEDYKYVDEVLEALNKQDEPVTELIGKRSRMRRVV